VRGIQRNWIIIEPHLVEPMPLLVDALNWLRGLVRISFFTLMKLESIRPSFVVSQDSPCCGRSATQEEFSSYGSIVSALYGACVDWQCLVLRSIALQPVPRRHLPYLG
jgi:hypothetical protein